MKLWQKDYTLDELIELFTVGEDYLLDQDLVPFDCQASQVHAQMLGRIGILNEAEVTALTRTLAEIIELHTQGQFTIAPSDEDCHTAIENYLTQKLGPVGAKIHTGRSRNDQIIAALRLYSKAKIQTIIEAIRHLLGALAQLSHNFGTVAMPGFSHTRKAMPSTVAIWSGAFQSALSDDASLLNAIAGLIDQNPLGSGAGYGVPLPIDRSFTTLALGFERTQENPLYVQNSRGKFEGLLLCALNQIMFDLNRMATDLIFFTLPELDFFSLPDSFLTGSSIMPHKKNPDVLEILRAQYHELLAYEFQIRTTIGNLISGYHRDLQLTKKPLMSGLTKTHLALRVAALVITGLKVNTEKCRAALTPELFATTKVYELVKDGIPFREAYRMVSAQLNRNEH